MNIKEKFTSRLGDPTSEKSLDDYISFCVNNNTTSQEDYTESHHILPVSVFPELRSDKQFPLNRSRLTYLNHLKAHELLAIAYPIPSFKAPVNLMQSFIALSEERASELRKDAASYAAKAMWDKVKADPKLYEEKIRKISENSRDMWINKSEEELALHSRRVSERMSSGQAKRMAHLLYENHNGSQRQSEHFKNMWSDEELREKIIRSMVDEKSTPEAKERMSASATKLWDEMREDGRYEEFVKTMSVVNKDTDKRDKASKSLKEKWKDPEFREKMKNRARGNNSKSLKEKWKDPEFREKMLAARKKTS